MNSTTIAERNDTLPEYLDKKIHRRKVRNKTEEATAIGGESDESESSIYRIQKMNRNTDRNKYLTARVKVNGIENEFMKIPDRPSQ